MKGTRLFSSLRPGVGALLLGLGMILAVNTGVQAQEDPVVWSFDSGG